MAYARNVAKPLRKPSCLPHFVVLRFRFFTFVTRGFDAPLFFSAFFPKTVPIRSTSAFTITRKSVLVKANFIVSKPLQRQTNDSSSNLVKIVCPPWALGHGFFNLDRRVDTGTECSLADDKTEASEYTAAIAWRMPSNMVMERNWRKEAKHLVFEKRVICLARCKSQQNEANTRAYAVVSLRFVRTPLCTLQFFVSFCRLNFRSTSSFELHFDKVSWWLVRCTIWCRLDVLVMNDGRCHLHGRRTSNWQVPRFYW